MLREIIDLSHNGVALFSAKRRQASLISIECDADWLATLREFRLIVYVDQPLFKSQTSK
jgi:hypothetical protein